jgi:hypothetical protein
MDPRRRLTFIISLAATIIFSSSILPLAVPPFGGYPLRQVAEVFLWQTIAFIGWPFAIFGALLSFFSGNFGTVAPFLLVLLYPAILALVARCLTSKRSRTWEFVLLHLLLLISFAAVWHSVRNGYNFMVG